MILERSWIWNRQTLGGDILKLETRSLFIKVRLCFTRTRIWCHCFPWWKWRPIQAKLQKQSKKPLLFRFKQVVPRPRAALFSRRTVPASLLGSHFSRAIWSVRHARRSDTGVQTEGFSGSSFKAHALNLWATICQKVTSASLASSLVLSLCGFSFGVSTPVPSGGWGFNYCNCFMY